LIPFDLPSVEPPSFPDRVFDVRDFGAVSDGATVNTQAFRRAIEACNDQGGGIVLISAGTWVTGPIHLRSNVNLAEALAANQRYEQALQRYYLIRRGFPENHPYRAVIRERIDELERLRR